MHMKRTGVRTHREEKNMAANCKQRATAKVKQESLQIRAVANSNGSGNGNDNGFRRCNRMKKREDKPR